MLAVRVPSTLPTELTRLLEQGDLLSAGGLLGVLSEFSDSVRSLVQADAGLIFWQSLGEDEGLETAFVAESEERTKLLNAEPLGLWFETGVHRALIDDIRVRTGAVSYSETTWPYPELTHPLAPPREYRIIVPFSSEFIFCHQATKPFLGYLCFWFDHFPQLTPKTVPWILHLPQVLSELVHACLLEDVLRFRNEISTFAHEIKRQVLAMREVIQSSKHDSRSAKQGTEFIERTLFRVLQRTNSILLAEKEGLGQLRIHTIEVDFEELLREAIDEMMPLIEASSMSISIEVANNIGRVWIDPAIFPSVIQNLVDNAIKYSEKHAQIRVRVESAETNTIELRVEDDGRSIAPDDFASIFARGYRERSVGSIAGSGLGLFLVRRIVEEHGGEVRVEAPSGKGKCFIVTLPRDRAGALPSLENSSVNL